MRQLGDVVVFYMQLELIEKVVDPVFRQDRAEDPSNLSPPFDRTKNWRPFHSTSLAGQMKRPKGIA
jgi:hypothetical protein